VFRIITFPQLQFGAAVQLLYKEIIIKVDGGNLLRKQAMGTFHDQMHVNLCEAVCMNANFNLNLGVILTCIKF